MLLLAGLTLPETQCILSRQGADMQEVRRLELHLRWSNNNTQGIDLNRL